MSDHGESAPERTSTTLLCRVRGQDSQAWQQLTGIYAPLVYAWCRSAGVPAQEAADIVQEVFAAVHRKLDTFRRDRPGDSFRRWLWRITRNRANDYFRACNQRPVPIGGSEAQLRWTELPEEEPKSTICGDGEFDSTLLKGLEYVRAEFREQTWRAFWMSTVEEMPTAAVAAELSMSTGAVRKAKFRVLNRLREELDGLI